MELEAPGDFKKLLLLVELPLTCSKTAFLV